MDPKEMYINIRFQEIFNNFNTRNWVDLAQDSRVLLNAGSIMYGVR